MNSTRFPRDQALPQGFAGDQRELGLRHLLQTAMVLLSAQGWITMILGAMLHQASSLLVIFNSMRLLRKKV